MKDFKVFTNLNIINSIVFVHLKLPNNKYNKHLFCVNHFLKNAVYKLKYNVLSRFLIRTKIDSKLMTNNGKLMI